MNKLIFQNTSEIILATNTFINVEEILKFEDTNLIELVKDVNLGLTTKIPIYHSDGTYLTKVVGTRVFPTELGKKAGVRIEKLSDVWECKLDGKTIFEIHHKKGESFKTYAELYTPEGYFVKCSESKIPGLINMNGDGLVVGGMTLAGNTFKNLKTGIWIRKDGSGSIG